MGFRNPLLVGGSSLVVVLFSLVVSLLFLEPPAASRGGPVSEAVKEEPFPSIDELKVKAREAHELLFADGEGLKEGEDVPSLEVFTENYIREALRRRSGKAEVHEGGRMKDAPQTMEEEVERSLGQKKMRQMVRKRVRPDKALEVLEPPEGHKGWMEWKVTCDRPLFGRHIYGIQPGCSPGPTPGLHCRRLVLEDFCSKAEQVAMVEAMRKGFEGLYHQGSSTLLVPEPFSKPRLGEEAWTLTVDLLERARLALQQHLGLKSLHYSGSLLKKMDFPPLQGKFQKNPNETGSFGPHVDKANIASYDWSALVYFNSVDEDYEGGELMFHDDDADRLVRTVAGRLVAFSSGLENVHRVRQMTRGSRYALIMWFTCSEQHAHPSLGRQPPGSRKAPSPSNFKVDELLEDIADFEASAKEESEL